MSDLPDDTRDLLNAVLEALDIPAPATIGDSEVHELILAERTMHVVVALRHILREQPRLDLPWHTAYLREQLAKHPATGYRTWGQPAQDGDA